MKKLKLILLLLTLCLGSQLAAQRPNPDFMEQSKRLARRNNHITKTFTGTVEKMLWSKHTFGGPFNGIIFKKPDGKLIHLKLSFFYGESIGPHIKEGQEIEVKVSSDELLFDLVLYKDLYYQTLEYELKQSISGIGNIDQIKTSEGTFTPKFAEQKSNGRIFIGDFGPSSTPVLDAKVSKRIKLKNKEGILVLENGDSLVFYRYGVFEDLFNQNYISYLRSPRSGGGLYYKSPNVFRMTSGNLKYAGGGIDIMGVLIRGNGFLQTKSVAFESLLTDDIGFVNGLVSTNSKSRKDTFFFARESAKSVQNLLNKGSNQGVKLYYRQTNQGNIVRAIDLNEQKLMTPRITRITDDSNDFFAEKITYNGTVTKVNYTRNENMSLKEVSEAKSSSIILDDSVYVPISDLTALSLANLIDEGEEITFDGWRRKEISSEINEGSKTVIVPHNFTIGRVKLENRSRLVGKL